MNDELNAVGPTTPISSRRPASSVPINIDEVVEVEHSDWVAIGVEHVVDVYPVLAGGRHDHGSIAST